MPPAQRSSLAGSFRIFKLAGISVYVHWSWLVVAFFSLTYRTSAYHLWVWNVAEYLSLFGIVLLHEFGHAFACRQVGGEANEIVLWPLGGIAFVNPPPRPGALLWSIAAGPLVNVVLMPVTIVPFAYASSTGLNETFPDAYKFMLMIMVINLVVFVFNMLPIYPLDGGQILQALLWFAVGRATSLLVVSIFGLVAAAGVILAVVFSEEREWWFVVLAVFAGFRCIVGFRQARLLAQMENAARHRDAACPSCGQHPLEGPFWVCEECRTGFDTFAHQGSCPGCGRQYSITTCPECQHGHPLWAWYDHAPPLRGEA